MGLPYIAESASDSSSIGSIAISKKTQVRRSVKPLKNVIAEEDIIDEMGEFHQHDTLPRGICDDIALESSIGSIAISKNTQVRGSVKPSKNVTAEEDIIDEMEEFHQQDTIPRGFWDDIALDEESSDSNDGNINLRNLWDQLMLTKRSTLYTGKLFYPWNIIMLLKSACWKRNHEEPKLFFQIRNVYN